MPENYFLFPDDNPQFKRRRGVLNKLTDLAYRLEDFFRRATFLALVVLAVIAGGLTGLVLAYQASFTSFAAEVESLADYRPSEVTKVYADDGKTVIGELALERRIPLAYEEIPDQMKKAILAIEDLRFYEHVGIDPVRLAGAFIENIKQNRRAQGASTLTQQLARLLFLNPEKTYIRKLREAMYALQIERYYTKEQILTLYCNQIFLGGGAYGVEAAANYYFSKSVKDLTLEECAMIAALPKAPQQYSPVLNAKAAKERRNLVLQAMADAGFITRAAAEAAKARPLKLNVDDARVKSDRSPYAYFVEEVRLELQRLLVEKHAQDAMDVYRAGLSVYTTLDAQAQQWATEAVRRGVRMYDRRHGWRGKLYNVIEKEGARLDSYRHPLWSAVTPQPGEILTGLIKEVNDRGTLVSFGRYSAVVTPKETQWTGRPPSRLFKPGDLAEFLIEEVDTAKRTLTVKLEQEPEVQGALALVDVKSGEIKALVGGYDFTTTKFNHATQANRQTGSAFKPFIYAAALEHGLQPDDIVDDAPFRRGNWEPHNYDNEYMGAMPLRKALALSRNIPAVRVLDEVGVGNAAQLVRRLGLPNPMAPFLPSALGATEEPLLAMVSAYAAFPNGGVRVEPFRIRRVVDRDGRVLEEAKPKSYKVLSAYVAAQMVDMMRGSVEYGTAVRARSLGRELAGKTGTVNDFTDAWFIGYTPSLACGTWIGFSEKRSLGKGESGSSAALPFWIDFMEKYLKDKPKERFGPIPEMSEDLKQTQIVRSREQAAARARQAAKSGDILPGTDEVPNLDPLGETASPRPAPTPEKPAPPPVAQPQPESPKPETRPKLVRPTPEVKPPEPEEKVRKGKKGKGGGNPPN
jgi:penicillin-binding protein 1A